jgi:hypothetical protein
MNTIQTINIRHTQFNQVSSIKERKRLQAERLEMKLRETEDKLIQSYRERIAVIEESDMDSEEKDSNIKILNEMIKDILKQRSEREIEKLRREQEERQAEIEKEQREKADKIRKNAPKPKDTEEAILKEDIRNMVEVSISLDSINALKQTKPLLEAESFHLQKAIEFQDDLVADSGVLHPVRDNDFQKTHLQTLEKGIAGIDGAINSKIGSLNNNIQNRADEKNEIILNSSNGTENKENEEIKDEPSDDNTAENLHTDSYKSVDLLA